MIREKAIQPKNSLLLREEDLEEAVRRIIEELIILEKPIPKDLDRIRIQVCRDLHLKRIPSNSEIICRLRQKEKNKLIPVLRRKPVRTISGIAVIAVMTKPTNCPHGRCTYCPGGPEQGVPQSYTGREPAAMRGAQNDYDPYQQVRARLSQLQAIGHKVDKSELIVMGGTFPATPRSYQHSFLKGCLEGLIGRRTRDLTEAIRLAETSRVRNVGITVETRPDCIDTSETDSLLSIGVTRVEIGVQNVYDEIYRLIHRGHKVKDVIEATKTLKDAGLKVCYHMMPGLPGSDPERDMKGFRTIFQDEEFKPDMLKIYPCLVLEGTELYDLWRKGEYTPYSDEEATTLIAEVKKITPPWVRIMRVQRDIPSNLIVAGVTHSNLRQLAKKQLEEEGIDCRCIRCREIGYRKEPLEAFPGLETLRREQIIEKASDGTEVFISSEFEDHLVGYLRLRIPSEVAYRPEIKNCNTSLVRELRVLGQMIPIGETSLEQWQHKGLGSGLLSAAEKIAKEDYDSRKILVTSAIGTRRYYQRLEYKLEGPYMSKKL
ncbi:MAG: tRNA uridine(34) 5-carboxymethylaminomethyl modification radical SAM/GNAT enzyme Elp3 [Candidatus Bathyarchaeota archaeon]|nr:MAG: tRNA uridine(34) 5-carboxymethylaminomethyl modification radical SAM/GNAT enzyme Elp3 [Candidatus Bathyarchaeota archaeon]